MIELVKKAQPIDQNNEKSKLHRYIFFLVHFQCPTVVQRSPPIFSISDCLGPKKDWT